MNVRERNLADLLKAMRTKYGVLGVKAEFESEGTRLEELMRLKEVASSAGAVLALKIGGPEDVRGIHDARKVGVHEIVAPMVESAYGLKKFLEAFLKYVPKDEREEIVAAVNIETIQSYKDLDNILQVGKAQGLHGVTIGRVDLAGSMDLGRAGIDSPEIFKITKTICAKAKKTGLRTVVGGQIEAGSLEFISKLVDAGVLDRFETRKVIFDARLAIADYKNAVRDAHRFDKIWLENKRDHYANIANEDSHRFPMLEKRINES